LFIFHLLLSLASAMFAIAQIAGGDLPGRVKEAFNRLTSQADMMWRPLA